MDSVHGCKTSIWNMQVKSIYSRKRRVHTKFHQTRNYTIFWWILQVAFYLNVLFIADVAAAVAADVAAAAFNFIDAMHWPEQKFSDLDYSNYARIGQ